jgi:hypothetical protein
MGYKEQSQSNYSYKLLTNTINFWSDKILLPYYFVKMAHHLPKEEPVHTKHKQAWFHFPKKKNSFTFNTIEHILNISSLVYL